MGLTCVTTAKAGVERQFQSCGWGSCNPLTIKLHSSRAFCKMLAFGKPGIYLSVSDSPVVFLCCDRHSISLGMNRGLKERKKKKKIKKKTNNPDILVHLPAICWHVSGLSRERFIVALRMARPQTSLGTPAGRESPALLHEFDLDMSFQFERGFLKQVES